MLNELRPKLKKYMDITAKKVNVHPNIITLIGLLVAILAAYCFFKHQLILAGLLILLSGFLDILDGAVARYHNISTTFGSLLDSTTDRVSDTSIIIGIILGGYVSWFVGIIAILVCYLISYVRCRAESLNIDNSVGIMERAERMILIVFGAFLQGVINYNVLEVVIYILIILGSLTVFQRLYHAKMKINE